MSNQEMNTAGQERAQTILKARQDAKKSKGERIEELEKRVEDLERLVDEIVQWKEDRVIIQIDKNGKPIGEATHRYRCSRRESKKRRLIRLLYYYI